MSDAEYLKCNCCRTCTIRKIVDIARCVNTHVAHRAELLVGQNDLDGALDMIECEVRAMRNEFLSRRGQ